MLRAALIFTFCIASPWSARAVVPCATEATCEERLWKGSRCRDGFCTNPFEGGCLRSLLDSEEHSQKYRGNAGDENSDGDVDMGAWRRRLRNVPRTCNSEDPPDAAARGLCSENANDYPEVRIWSQNWESAFIVTWMMQIIYSELLGVPSTIETGAVDKNLNFYEETNRMDYGIANEYKMFQHAYDAPGGDCSVYNKDNRGASDADYIPCAHAVMEIWTQNGELKDAQKEGVLEPVQFAGVIAVQGWHITRFSLARDPSLAHYFGLQGESNRRKLAETFKRPTAWGHYCARVSRSNCTIADDVAERPPAEDGSEDGLYFSSGSYTGWFRATDKNNCTETEECTGHIMDYPCGWSSYIKQQTKHLGIALESDGGEGRVAGYTYDEMVDIWNAANATKSDVIGLWWTPDATANNLKGSGSDLMPVVLPAATQECLDNRIDVNKRCSPSATEFDIYGDERGACGRPSVFTQKAAVGNMKSNIAENANPKSRMSPAHAAFEDFTVTDLQVDEILTEWVDRGQDRDNFDLRFATCRWMLENLEDVIEKVVPPSHPLVFVEVSKANPWAVTTLVVSTVAILVTIGTALGLGKKHRQGKLGKGVQIEFLGLLLAGLFLVSLGGLLLALEPSKGTCVSSMWLINVGYATQLVPTLLRVSAIIKIVRASRKMKNVTVNIKKLLLMSVGFSSIAALYSMFWTIFDPPQSQMNLDVSQSKNDFGETIVSVSHSCTSDSLIWFMVMCACQGILLIGASVLAYQMKHVPNVVNDSKRLTRMIYSSSIFLILRIVLYVLSGTHIDGQDPLQKARSLFISLDSFTSVVIYFFRFFFPDKKMDKAPQTFATFNTQRAGPVFVPPLSDIINRRTACLQRHGTVHLQQSNIPENSPETPHAGMRRQNTHYRVRSGATNGMPSASMICQKTDNFPQSSATNGIRKGADGVTGYFARSGIPETSTGAHQAPSSTREEVANLRQTSKSEILAQEEKEEEDSPLVRFRMEDQSVAIPKWVVEEYGEFSKHESESVLKYQADKAMFIQDSCYF